MSQSEILELSQLVSVVLAGIAWCGAIGYRGVPETLIALAATAVAVFLTWFVSF